MGSKYSSELKQGPNHDASTSFSKEENDTNDIENVSIFHLFNCWRCICFRPRYFRTVRSRPSTENFNNTNNKASDEIKLKKVNDNHAMQLKSSEVVYCEKRWVEEMSENCQVEIYQNNQNVALAESACEKSKRQNSLKPPNNKKPLILNQKNFNKRSMSLKSCRAIYGHSVPINNNLITPGKTNSDLKTNFLSRLMSLSVDGKQRLGYMKQVNDQPILNDQSRDVDDAEEDKNEQDELLDHGRFSSERQFDFLKPVDSMEYFDSTPSTEDRFMEACLRFQNRHDNTSTDLYEESCLENLESFCDKSVLLASMDTIDLGSSIESLLICSQDNIAFDCQDNESPSKDLEGYILMDLTTYKSLVDELEVCRQILGQLESLLSNAYLH